MVFVTIGIDIGQRRDPTAIAVVEKELRPVTADLIMTDPEATAAFISYAVKSGTA